MWTAAILSSIVASCDFAIRVVPTLVPNSFFPFFLGDNPLNKMVRFISSLGADPTTDAEAVSLSPALGVESNERPFLHPPGAAVLILETLPLFRLPACI